MEGVAFALDDHASGPIELLEELRFVLDASDNPVLKESIKGADAPIGVALSPDGLQMFTGGHLNTDTIDRYQYSAESDSWARTSKFKTPVSLGFMMVLSGRR